MMRGKWGRFPGWDNSGLRRNPDVYQITSTDDSVNQVTQTSMLFLLPRALHLCFPFCFLHFATWARCYQCFCNSFFFEKSICKVRHDLQTVSLTIAMLIVIEHWPGLIHIPVSMIVMPTNLSTPTPTPPHLRAMAIRQTLNHWMCIERFFTTSKWWT